MSKRIVFVHGFMGGRKTWGNLPTLIGSDFECMNSEYGFDTLYWPFVGKTASLQNLAEGLLSEIKLHCNLEKEEIVLVGHSLGGLVIRQMLVNLELKRENLNIKKIAFFAVPHDGSGFANVAKFLPIKCNKLAALCKDGSIVENLNDHWGYADLDLKYEILTVVGGKDAIVNANSAKSIFRKHQVLTNIDAGHKDIVKASNKSDFSYLALKGFIDASRTIDKYSNKTSVAYDAWIRHDLRKHNSIYVPDEKRKIAAHSLEAGLEGEKRLVRISGLSGLGKSRMVLEYIKNSSEINESNILVFISSAHVLEIRNCLAEALADKASGLVVVDNCSVEMHEYISRDMDAMPSELRIITLGFDHDAVKLSCHIKLEAMSSDSIREIISGILPDFDLRDIARITTFVEGYPLLALLIAKRYRDDGVLNGKVSDQDFVDKLVNVGGTLSEVKQSILKLCSLFDVFGIQRFGGDEAKFLYGMANANQSDFDQLITAFVDRQIINQVGDYARIVPKPLAVFLAVQWWGETLEDTKKKLLFDMPESMITSFCNQVKYLDSSTQVQKFVEGISTRYDPFGQAELLLSNRGSRLFRGLVEVNPKATSNALYNVFQEVGDKAIGSINSETRRELVWALEMLCWHKSHFEKSAWCLFKLACFESESYSNNSTGQLSQLFRWRNSGTEANFDQRLALLDRGVKVNTETTDTIVIKIIKEAISAYVGGRAIGAEQQGTKLEMQEWVPDKSQQLFNYWDVMLHTLLGLSDKPHATNLVKDTIGHEIRGLAIPGMIATLDYTIKEVIRRHGKYWPAATQTIIHALKYDSEEASEEVKTALLCWQQLLSPDENNLKEQLILTVLDPSREHEEDENGELIDMAARGAVELANALDSTTELISLFDFIITFPHQKQSWLFGEQIISRIDVLAIDDFISGLLRCLTANESSRFEFIAGCFRGLNNRDPELWSEKLSGLLKDEKLKPFYPDALRTGVFDIAELMIVIELIKGGVLTSQNATYFGHGRVISHLSEDEVVVFCSELAGVDDKGIWAALDILDMYMLGSDGYDFQTFEPLLKNLLLNVTFKRGDGTGRYNAYHWQKNVKILIENSDSFFALGLVDFLLEQVAYDEIDISVVCDDLYPVFYDAFELCASDIWPSFSKKLLELTESKFVNRLTYLLGNGKYGNGRRKSTSIFTLVDEDVVVGWCSNEKALHMVVSSLKLLDPFDDHCTPNNLLLCLIDRYPDSEYLHSKIRLNYHSRSWSGSLVPYLQADKEALLPLRNHPSAMVQKWADEFISMLESEISENLKRESEENFVFGR